MDRIAGGTRELTQPKSLPVSDEVPEVPDAGHLGILWPCGERDSPPKDINYPDVQLAAGQRWTYEPPLDHEVAWLAVSDGTIRTPEQVWAGEFVAFEESNQAVVIRAESASRFVLGSAAKHPHDLVLERY